PKRPTPPPRSSPPITPPRPPKFPERPAPPTKQHNPHPTPTQKAPAAAAAGDEPGQPIVPMDYWVPGESERHASREVDHCCNRYLCSNIGCINTGAIMALAVYTKQPNALVASILKSIDTGAITTWKHINAAT